MKKLIILFTIFLISCQEENYFIPPFYYIQIDWGTYWDNQHINHFYYFSNKDSATIYVSDYKDSVSKTTKFKIDKIYGDSLFIYAYKNSRNFNLYDTIFPAVADADNISISLHAYNRTVANSYSAIMTYEIDPSVSRIIHIVEKTSRDTTLF